MLCESRPPCDELNRFEVRLQEYYPISEHTGQRKIRVPTSLHEQDLLLEDQWYMQGGNPTCVVWSIGNASRALGLPLPENFLQLLHCEAKNGMFLNKPIEIMRLYCNETSGNIGLKEPPEKQQLRTVHMKNDHVTQKKYSHFFDRYAHKSAQNEQESIARADILHNGHVIKNFLSAGNIPIINVDNSRLFEIKWMNHALCIVGYRVTPESYMDIQFVDSLYGRSFLVPLERFSEAVFSTMDGGNTLIVERSS